MEKNRVEFTGTVERLRSIPTRSGTPMVKWLLKVGEHRFQCVAFGNLAAAVLAAGEGKEVGLVGQASINSWKTDDGAWRNDFQVTAWCIEVDGSTTHFEKGQGAARKPTRSVEQPRQQQLPRHQGPPPPDEFDYRGGPF
jgi:single-stranded DNA-binding protein